MPYAAPLADMRLVLDAVGGLSGEAAELAGPVLEEAARFAASELDPLNQPGDRTGSVLENGVVRTPTGFREAYRQYIEGGWMGLAVNTEHGGQGLPSALSTPVVEMLNSACMGWALCPLLSAGAIDMLAAHGSAEQKQLYLAKLVSGEWTGTMNLTEPQAGSDLGALRTRAVPRKDERWGEHYRIAGQKIFITYGDHDLTDNIIHMVLARTPDAPPGSRGISLFLVPKFLPDGEGRPGERNDLRPLRLEEKLGIHASPTCVMSFGEGDGAIGWRIGEENRGLEAMFTMMNSERLGVGVQGVAIAERAYQQARDYARNRVQGMPVGMERGAGPIPPIVYHPDVRRMLLSMKAATEAMRALAYLAAAAIDAGRSTTGEAQFRAQRRADLLIPIVKAWCTDLGVEIASIAEMRASLGELDAPELAILRQRLTDATAALDTATAYLVTAEPALAAAGSAPYLNLCGTVLGGWLMARVAAAALQRHDAALSAAKLATRGSTPSIFSRALRPISRRSWAAPRSSISTRIGCNSDFGAARDGRFRHAPAPVLPYAAS